MKMKRRGFVFVALFCVSLFGLASMASAAVDKVICVPWQGDISKYHTAISGQAVQLKGVIKTTDTSMVWYKWVFGDGTADSAITSLSGSTKYNVEITHTYTAATGTPFTAQLQVANNNAVADPKIVDTYLVKIEDNTLDARINIAIDKGLWYLYKTQTYGTYAAGTYGPNPVNYGYWSNTGGGGGYDGYYFGPTSSAVQAFEINNHLQNGNPDEDPYVEAVARGFNWMFANTNVQAIGAQTGGLPEDYNNDGVSEGNGIAISCTGARQIYELGQGMDAIIASKTPLETAKTGPTNVIGRTYKDILQDMIDMYAWGQYDGSYTWPARDGYAAGSGIVGGWRYNWGDFPDNSASQWGAIGIIPAERNWGLKVPNWVKNLNNNWLKYSYNDASTTTGTFGYTGTGSVTYGTIASGMVQIAFCDLPSTDGRWVKAEKYFANNWTAFLNEAEYYNFYAFAKAMRLALPSPVETLSNGVDWYRGTGATTGLAKKIVDIQSADGSWPYADWPYVGIQLRTAWMVITLRPTLFAAAPIACFNASPNPSYPDQPITFDPSCSSHSEAGKGIGNLTKFEWDWNNDGVYDTSSTLPAVQIKSFPCAVLPCIYPVTLRVTDDNTPPLTATAAVNINITNPPHPPVANPGGPYTVSTCSIDTLTLDGSKSYDQDEGQHEAGCTTCPNDTITAWDWDLVPPLTFATIDKSGKIVTLDASNIASYFTVVGLNDIGLRVTDNTKLSYPGSGQPNLTNAAFTTVDKKAGCICNLIARAKLTKIQLTWTPTGAPSYDIYRSTAGPNTGFVKIAGGIVSTYATYLDQSVVIGTKYYYRVISNSAAGPCGSNATSATPTAR
jgi:hypothetical protein